MMRDWASQWRPMAAGAVVVGSVVLLTGCSLWGGASKPKPAELGPNVPVLAVRQAWTAKIGSTAGLPMEILVNGSTVTVASVDGTVAAIDARTGGDVWRASVGGALSAGVGGDGKWTAVVTQKNDVVVLSGGREIWRQQLQAQSYTPPLVAGNRVFVLAADRSLSAYDAATGQRLWNQQRPGEPLTLRQRGVLMAVGDTLVAGLSDSGTVRWEAPLASPRGTNDVERLVEIVGPTSRIGDVVCARAFQAAIGCVDARRGTVNWTQTANGAEGVHGDENLLFGAESNGTVTAWSRQDGSKAWSSERLQYRKLTAPLVLGRSVIIGDESGLVHLLSRDDGSSMNRLNTDASGVAIAPAASADTLVVVTRSGSIYGFRPE